MYPTAIFEIQAELCRTMSNAIRLEIVHHLRQGPKCIKEIAQATEQSPNEISRHLGALRYGGILTFHRSGQDITYPITNPKIVEICSLMREVLMEEAPRRSRMVEDFHGTTG
jgi:DNA-binding transcriptional ArsR family regulator